MRFSIPEQLHSDQGRQFKSKLLSEICHFLNIQKSRTTPYHPQSDGLVERFNRTLLDMLATCTKDHPFDWENYIRKVCMAYNTSVQCSTGYTPFYLMFGRQARILVDIMYDTANTTTPQTPGEYATALQNRLKTAFEIVQNRLSEAYQRQKDFYNRKVHGEPHKPGDLVWLYSTVAGKGKRKLHHQWTGPYKVTKKLSDVTYRIQHAQRRNQRKVHFDRLKSCPMYMRFDSEVTSPPHQPQGDTLSTNTINPSVGAQLELVDDDDDDLQPSPLLPLLNNHLVDILQGKEESLLGTRTMLDINLKTEDSLLKGGE